MGCVGEADGWGILRRRDPRWCAQSWWRERNVGTTGVYVAQAEYVIRAVLDKDRILAKTRTDKIKTL
jgi:hypothetical protein